MDTSDLIKLKKNCKKINSLVNDLNEENLANCISKMKKATMRLDNWSSEIPLGAKIQENLKSDNDKMSELVDGTKILLNKISILISTLENK